MFVYLFFWVLTEGKKNHVSVKMIYLFGMEPLYVYMYIFTYSSKFLVGFICLIRYILRETLSVFPYHICLYRVEGRCDNNWYQSIGLKIM